MTMMSGEDDYDCKDAYGCEDEEESSKRDENLVFI